MEKYFLELFISIHQTQIKNTKKRNGRETTDKIISLQGFSDFVFRWYLETGKRGKLLCQGAGQQGGELARFLQDYSSLAWLHQINTRDYTSACSTLRHLAQEESTYLSRKKVNLQLFC